MKQFQRLGVFLNDEPGDDEALAYTSRIAELASSSTLLCVHVRGVEKSASTQMPSEQEIRARILKVLPESITTRTSVEVHEGTGIREILRSAVDLDLDLLIVGKRLPHDQLAAGSAFTRLARKSPCSVLVVPHGTRPHLGRIVALIDGSEHSKAALLVALAFARSGGESNPQVLAQSVYTVNYGYQYAGLSLEEAAGRMEQIRRDEIAIFLSGVDISGIAFETVLTCSDSVERAAEDLASARNMDLIVLGSHGKSTGPAGLIGSNSERLLATCPLPVLLVKKKGETVRFLDALFAHA